MHHSTRNPLLLSLAAVSTTVFLVACDRSGESQRLAEERAALEREKAELAAEKAAAQQTATDQERARLDAERAALENEKARMAADQTAKDNTDRTAAITAERERRMAAEQKAADEAVARRDAEARERDARAAADQAAEKARDAQNIDFFYTALDPHGDWVQLDRYGFAFRPRAARDPNWRPYTAGGWVYTDYGWTWRSDEPFGWATYHYGRWARVPRLGWVWVPGSEWGPAWVSWRRSNDYVGWAPLPPDAWSSSGFTTAVDSYYDIGPGLYVFLRVADFGEPTYTRRVVAPEQNVTIINQTVNVTNVVYQKVQNHVTVVNNGPDLTVINKSSRLPVRRLGIERIASGAPQSGKIEGNVFRVVAPLIQNAKPIAAPKAVRDEVKPDEVDRGWRDAKAIEPKLREESRKQAREAEEAQRRPAPPIAQPTEVTKPLPPNPPKPGRDIATPPAPRVEKPAIPPTPSIRKPGQPISPGKKPETAPKPEGGFQGQRPTNRPQREESTMPALPPTPRAEKPAVPPEPQTPKAEEARPVEKKPEPNLPAKKAEPNDPTARRPDRGERVMPTPPPLPRTENPKTAPEPQTPATNEPGPMKKKPEGAAKPPGERERPSSRRSSDRREGAAPTPTPPARQKSN